MFEVDEDETCGYEIADTAGTECDVFDSGPAFGEKSEPSFTKTAQRPLQRVAGAVVDDKTLPSAGCLNGTCAP